MEIENKESTEITDEDQELVEETASRLTDLSLALCYYDSAMAKTALALALGNICGHEDDEPCLHHAFEIAEEQHDFIHEQRAEEKAEKSNN